MATTLALAEQNHAEELKRVCLEFSSKNLREVMESEGYQHMKLSCPQLEHELLRTVAIAKEERAPAHRSRHHARAAGDDGAAAAAARHHTRALAGAALEVGGDADENARRVRQRRE